MRDAGRQPAVFVNNNGCCQLIECRHIWAGSRDPVRRPIDKKGTAGRKQPYELDPRRGSFPLIVVVANHCGTGERPPIREGYASSVTSPRSDGTGSVWKLADRTAPLPRLSPSSSRSTSASCRTAMIISRSANCSRGRRRTSCHAVVAPMALPGLSPISAPQNTHSNAVSRFSTGSSNAPSILILLSASPSG